MVAKLAATHFDVGIVTNDREAAMAFWSGYLGFPVQGEVSFPGMTIIRLEVGDAILRICVKDEPVARRADCGAFDAESGLRYLTLKVQNLDELVGEAQSHGYPVPFPPREIRPGHRIAQIQDGQGVTVELVEIAAS